ncbi:MAG: protease inhibitor I42 family protein [Alphaproteobacteria bacterium]|jgi:predicted secreted protein
MKTLTKAFNTATVRAGEAFRLELPSDPSTGYLWDVTVTSGAASIVSQQFKSAADHPPGEFVCGGLGIEEVVFKAPQSGQIVIEATQSRPWLKTDPTAQKTRFTVTVI